MHSFSPIPNPQKQISRPAWHILLAISLVAFPHKSIAAAKPRIDEYARAVAQRDQLEALPAAQRSRDQYESVLNAFRAIYHAHPDAAKAPAAVAAVADLLAEKGRVLSDQHALQAAIGQYEFLREQYPRSPQTENALLLEAEICRQDLKDNACAEEKFQTVLDESPNSSLGEQASLELKAIQAEKEEAARAEAARLQAETAKSSSRSKKSRAAIKRNNSRSTQASSTPPSIQPSQASPSNPPARSPSLDQAQTTQSLRDAKLPTVSAAGSDYPAQAAPPAQQNISEPATTSQSHKIVMITGMRHWSNPTSTRIAIDLGGQVEYEAARVPDPDRIFFDLHGARLAPSLNGHQVEVIDDGYLKRIRAAQFQPDVTRVVLDVTDVSQYSAFLLPNPWRLIIDIHSDKGASKAAIDKSKIANVQATDGTRPLSQAQPISPFQQGAKSSTKSVANTSGNDSTVAEVAKLSAEPAKIPATAGPTSSPVSAKIPAGTQPSSIDPQSTRTPMPQSSTNKSRKRSSQANTDAAVSDNAPLPHAADPTADGQRSLVRALGLKVGRIVIDAGHGGHDSGTLGPGGIQEKDVVLDVALRVGKLLHQRLGAEIVYTRDDDTFIPLETRTAIANKAQADLFLSIHANSSQEPSARGVETYYLNFTSDPAALDVAARENAVSNQSVHQLSDLVRKITLKDKIDESREFATDVDSGLYAGLKKGNEGLKDRGVKKAPFVVLIGAQMPSILAEISFLTNPTDAEQLRDPAYRERIAESLVSGVERYLRGLSGSRPSESTPARSAITIDSPAAEPISGR